MILKRNGTTVQRLRENCAVSLAVRKFPERGVSSSYSLRTKQPAVLAREANLMALRLACEVFSGDRTCSAAREKALLAKKPSDRNPTLNTTAKATNFSFSRDIKNEMYASG